MPTLNFKGKTFVQNHHLAVKHHQLIPQKELSQTDTLSLHDNLIIHGDNLAALKSLLPTYAGKIKCIYIDPPYNTGNENWVYNDNVNSPMIKDWLGKTVDKEDMTRHDKWLCLMMPRLKLLRELLSEDGAIFISIDDNEQHHLRCLLDEIFGESNFITNFIWKKKQGGGNDSKSIVVEHEYVICYLKSEHGLNFNLDSEHKLDDALYPFSDDKGEYGLVTLDKSSIRQSDSLVFEIEDTNGNIYSPREVKGKKSCWRWSKAKVQKDFDLLVFKNGKVYTRYYRPDGVTPKSLLIDSRFGRTETGKELLGELLKDNSFSYPKPLELIQHLLRIYTNENDIILDSFAGSGTTAHAVLELNKEDGGNRKFILIEQEDYANTITAERVRRVINGVETAKNETLKNGLGGTFSYFKLGEPIEMESILRGETLPSFVEFARYIFYTATGEEFNEQVINESTGFIGTSKNHDVYMFYKPEIEWLKQNALTLNRVNEMPKYNGKQRLVFAPAKYVDDETCRANRIDFCQLPYEIYRMV